MIILFELTNILPIYKELVNNKLECLLIILSIIYLNDILVYVWIQIFFWEYLSNMKIFILE